MRRNGKEPLRKCRYCGKEAWTEEDLNLFLYHKNYKFHRRPYCKECHAKFQREGRYKESHLKACREWLKRNWEKHKSAMMKRITFKGQRIYLKNNPRKNICSICGKRYKIELSEQTHLHHDFYDESDPLNGTRELCRSCHKKIHELMKKGVIV